MTRRPVLTKEIAYAGGRDAGNTSVRRNARSRWNEDDWAAAAATVNNLLDLLEKLEKQ